MEVLAKLRHLRLAPRKGQRVADLVRGQPCEQALVILRGCGKAAGRPMEKLIRSALANAEEQNARNSAGIDLDNLYVKKITVDQGPRMWRMRPRAHGRAAWINKGLSHMSVVLDER